MILINLGIKMLQTNEYGPILFVIPQDGLAVFGHDGTSAVLDSLTGEVRWRIKERLPQCPCFVLKLLLVTSSSFVS